MNKKHFDTNLERFSKILEDNGTDMQAFLFHSRVYVEGIRDSVSETERYLDKGARILDLGCGTGFLSMLLGDSGFNVDGIDVEINNPEMIEEFQKKKGLQGKIWKALENSNHNIKFHFYNGTKFPFDNQSFDAVVAHAVVEHIPAQDRVSVFREIRRVLRPGGHLLVFRTPRKRSCAEFVARTLHLGSHSVLMTEHEIISMLENSNFKIVHLQRTDMIFGILPGKLQYVWNFLSPALLLTDKILLKTPISYLAHYVKIICLKT